MHDFISLRSSTYFLFAALATLILADDSDAAWPHDPNVNLPIRTAAGDQEHPQMVSDGEGGGIVVWIDSRDFASASYDIYAQHFLSSGEVDPTWPADGLAVCNQDSFQSVPRMTSDGAGGTIVIWYDSRNGNYGDIYGQHVLSSGEPDPAWPVDGLAVCTVAGDKYPSGIVSDGSGGAIVVWEDKRTGAWDIYAQRVLPSGETDPVWPVNGLEVCDEAGTQENGAVATDGAGGAIVVWIDSRNGAGDIYAQHVLVSGQRAWIGIGREICTAPETQYSPMVVPDAAGGAMVAWIDQRTVGLPAVYAQHVLASGALNPAYSTNVPVCTIGGVKFGLYMVSDASGGALVAWADTRGTGYYDLYAHHIEASGTVDPTWTPDGILLAGRNEHETTTSIISDGAGGAIVAFDYGVATDNVDAYAQHVTVAGLPDTAMWGADGHAISTAATNQAASVMISDGMGGAIVAWHDMRSGEFDIYAQRIARFGVLGSPEPKIASVRDVPNDQGGLVVLAWDASWLDSDAVPTVDQYWVFRSLVRTAGKQAPPSGALPWVEIMSASKRPPALGTLFAKTDGTETYYWEYIDNVSAFHIVPGYGYLAETTGDSTSVANPMTHFMVVARDLYGEPYWASAPDSGYSVDNLAPLAPRMLKFSGDRTLTWRKSPAPDLEEYAVYAGDDEAADRTGVERLGTTKDTLFVLPPTVGEQYLWVTAVDSNENESEPSNVVWADGATGGAPVPGSYFLAQNVPNPFNPVTTIRFGLPRPGRVVLSVNDFSGRRIVVLADDDYSAGEFLEVWDGRDESGREVASGIYFARLESGGFTTNRKMVLIR